MILKKLSSRIFLFPLEKEEEFSRHYIESTKKQNRIALLIGILIYASFSLLDLYTSPNISMEFWKIRFGFVIPIASGILILSFHKNSSLFIQLSFSFVSYISGFGILKMIEIANPPINYLYFSGLILIFIYLYSFFRIKFLWSVATGVLLLITHALYSILSYNYTAVISISITTFLIAAAIIGMISNYTIEYYIRMEYLKSDLLNRESEKVTEANMLLEKRVEERTKELKISKELAEKSEKLKTEFLAQISHEIRSPINTILNLSYLIKNEDDELTSDEINDCYSGITHAGERIVRTIDLILNMSEIQLKSYEYHSKQFDLAEILEKLTSQLQYLASSKGLELKFIKNCINSILIADEYTIYQIFDNLINNAIKYTNEGKIHVTLTDLIENKLTVEVVDTGIGISNEYLPKIFDSFTQEEVGYTRRYDGNGLGLTLVKNYCDLNNAQITVESKKGSGSKFIVVLNI